MALDSTATQRADLVANMQNWENPSARALGASGKQKYCNRRWYIARGLIAIVMSILGGACATSSAPVVTSVEQCRQAYICRSRGTLEMSNDGHAYIGKLVLPDGRCINVSLPKGISTKLALEPPRSIIVEGRVLPYGYEDSVVEYKVNGREIGYGNCGDFLIFVK